MTSREELLAMLSAAADDDQDDDEEPVQVLNADLGKLSAADLPIGVALVVVENVAGESGAFCPVLNGVVSRVDDDRLVATINEFAWRKYWPESLGVVEYHDLVRAAVEARSRRQADVYVDMRVDEEVVYGFIFGIRLPWGQLKDAVEWARKVHGEIVEAAEAARVGVDDLVATAFKRLEGWGSQPLDSLVDRIREGTAQEKGRALEELATRLFNTIPGFSATGHVVTSTEEIDVRIQNTSDDPYWRQESYLLIAECKNWSGKCGKDEFVLFKNKLRNRVGRVTCGFLISWNGFAETVSKEMLRASEGDLLVVPIGGSDLRAAVRDNDFPSRLKRLHEDAIFL